MSLDLPIASALARPARRRLPYVSRHFHDCPEHRREARPRVRRAWVQCVPGEEGIKDKRPGWLKPDRGGSQACEREGLRWLHESLDRDRASERRSSRRTPRTDASRSPGPCAAGERPRWCQCRRDALQGQPQPQRLARRNEGPVPERHERPWLHTHRGGYRLSTIEQWEDFGRRAHGQLRPPDVTPLKNSRNRLGS